MKLFVMSSTLIGIVIATGLTSIVQAKDNSFSGTVKRTWEDGFSLKTDERTITVDSWDVCGDNTSRNLSKGDSVTVEGEFEGGEFDAFSITKSDNVKVCQN